MYDFIYLDIPKIVPPNDDYTEYTSKAMGD